MDILGITLAGILSSATAAISSEDMLVNMDHGEILSFSSDVGQVIVSDPTVADIEVLSHDKLMVFGRLPGTTTVFLFGRDGAVQREILVRVQNGLDDRVTLYNGQERITFACAMRCEPTYLIGDGINGVRPGPVPMPDQVQARQALTDLSAESQAAVESESVQGGEEEPSNPGS